MSSDRREVVTAEAFYADILMPAISQMLPRTTFRTLEVSMYADTDTFERVLLNTTLYGDVGDSMDPKWFVAVDLGSDDQFIFQLGTVIDLMDGEAVAGALVDMLEQLADDASESRAGWGQQFLSRPRFMLPPPEGEGYDDIPGISPP